MTEMHKLLQNILLMLLVATITAGCKDSALESQLDYAELNMDEYPDSVMAVLKGTDVGKIRNRSQRARCALLYSQALDKNHIYVTDDSIIRIAADYYKSNGALLYRFKSLYYLGRVQYHAGDYVRSITTYTEAEMLAGDIDDDFMKGLLYREMGEVYQIYADYKKSIGLYKRAYRYFKRAGKTRHCNFLLMSLGLMYDCQSQYKEAMNYFDKALKSAKESNDTILAGDVLAYKAVYYTEQKQAKKALDAYNEMLVYDTRPGNTSFNCNLAMMFALNGDFEKSAYHHDLALASVKNAADSIDLYNEIANVYEAQGDYKLALKNFKKFNAYENEYIKNLLSQPLLTAQRNVLAEELKLKEYKERQRGILYVLSVVFIVGAFVGYVVVARKRRDAKLNKYADIIQELQNALNTKSQITTDLFQEHFQYINDMGNSFFEQDNDAKGHKTVYKEINSMITNFRDDKNTKKELSELVDKCRNGVLTKMREQMTDLSEVEVQQFCYHSAGFSVKLIAMFLDESTANIYKRRARMKEKIIKAAPVDCELF